MGNVDQNLPLTTSNNGYVDETVKSSDLPDIHESKKRVRVEDFPPGYRFRPTDYELIHHYLEKKVMNKPLPCNFISDVNIYEKSPEELSVEYQKYLLGEEWYFFTPRDRKYPKGWRPARTTSNGYWKATGADKDVKFGGEVVGKRKALVFYQGKPSKGNKTNWIMHEYKVTQRRQMTSNNDMRLDDWVLCRIYKKDKKPREKNEVEETNVEPTEDGETNDQVILAANTDVRDGETNENALDVLGTNEDNELNDINCNIFGDIQPNLESIFVEAPRPVDPFTTNYHPENFHYGRSWEGVPGSSLNDNLFDTDGLDLNVDSYLNLDKVDDLDYFQR